MKKSVQSQITVLILIVVIIFLSNLSLAQQLYFTLIWSPNTESNLSHYVMYRDTIPGTMVKLDSCPHPDTSYFDLNIIAGKTYYYKLTAVDNAGNESTPSEEVSATAGMVTILNDNGTNEINDFELKQNYPNPFNPTTTIEYNLPTSSGVKISIYNVLGKEIRTLVDDNKSAGNHRVIWDGTDNSGRSVSSGIYFYQMISKNFSQVKRLALQK